jgi:two-component system, OmpR family, sensor histidine kinase ChvG
MEHGWRELQPVKRRTTAYIALSLVALILVPAISYYWLLGFMTKLEDNEAEHLRTSAAAVAGLLAQNDTVLAQLTNDMTGAMPVIPITGTLVTDGQQGDWPEHSPLVFGEDNIVESHQPYSAASLTCRLSVAADSSYVYLFYDVTDDNVVYREFNNPSVHRNDHIRIGLISGDSLKRYTIANLQPAAAAAHVISESGRALRRATDISGAWRATADGYNVELRIPRHMAVTGFATVVVDVDDPINRDVRLAVGTGPTSAPSLLGRLHFTEPDMGALLNLGPFAITVSDKSGKLLGQGGSSETETDSFMWFKARPVSVSTQIRRQGEPIGTVTLQGVTSSSAVLGNRLLISLVSGVMLLAGLACCLFLLLRLDLNRRLGNIFTKVVDTAGSPAGSPRLPTLALASDGVETLGEALVELVSRIQQHNDYLARMASSLNHELRTPVSVVRSSLDHLSASDVAIDEQVYVQRAQDGIARLTTILHKMSEARRLEESLDEDEVVRFNLAQVVAGCVDGYRIAYPDADFSLHIEDGEVPVTGIPELLAQLLDKLVDNAAGFATGDEPIAIDLVTKNGNAVLQVTNDGTGLPDDMADALFESMVSVRKPVPGDSADATHLGLGLYVARVITDFHGGTIRLCSRQDTPGAVATVIIPLLRLTAKLR